MKGEIQLACVIYFPLFVFLKLSLSYLGGKAMKDDVSIADVNFSEENTLYFKDLGLLSFVC